MFRRLYSKISGGMPLYETAWETRKDDEWNLYDPECVEECLKECWAGLKEKFRLGLYPGLKELLLADPGMLCFWIEDQDGKEVWSGPVAIGDMYNE